MRTSTIAGLVLAGPALGQTAVTCGADSDHVTVYVTVTADSPNCTPHAELVKSAQSFCLAPAATAVSQDNVVASNGPHDSQIQPTAPAVVPARVQEPSYTVITRKTTITSVSGVRKTTVVPCEPRTIYYAGSQVVGQHTIEPPTARTTTISRVHLTTVVAGVTQETVVPCSPYVTTILPSGYSQQCSSGKCEIIRIGENPKGCSTGECSQEDQNSRDRSGLHEHPELNGESPGKSNSNGPSGIDEEFPDQENHDGHSRLNENSPEGPVDSEPSFWEEQPLASGNPESTTRIRRTITQTVTRFGKKHTYAVVVEPNGSLMTMYPEIKGSATSSAEPTTTITKTVTITVTLKNGRKSLVTMILTETHGVNRVSATPTPRGSESLDLPTTHFLYRTRTTTVTKTRFSTTTRQRPTSSAGFQGSVNATRAGSPEIANYVLGDSPASSSSWNFLNATSASSSPSPSDHVWIPSSMTKNETSPSSSDPVWISGLKDKNETSPNTTPNESSAPLVNDSSLLRSVNSPSQQSNVSSVTPPTESTPAASLASSLGHLNATSATPGPDDLSPERTLSSNSSSSLEPIPSSNSPFSEPLPPDYLPSSKSPASSRPSLSRVSVASTEPSASPAVVSASNASPWPSSLTNTIRRGRSASAKEYWSNSTTDAETSALSQVALP